MWQTLHTTYGNPEELIYIISTTGNQTSNHRKEIRKFTTEPLFAKIPSRCKFNSIQNMEFYF